MILELEEISEGHCHCDSSTKDLCVYCSHGHDFEYKEPHYAFNASGQIPMEGFANTFVFIHCTLH